MSRVIYGTWCVKTGLTKWLGDFWQFYQWMSSYQINLLARTKRWNHKIRALIISRHIFDLDQPSKLRIFYLQNFDLMKKIASVENNRIMISSNHQILWTWYSNIQSANFSNLACLQWSGKYTGSPKRNIFHIEAIQENICSYDLMFNGKITLWNNKCKFVDNFLALL